MDAVLDTGWGFAAVLPLRQAAPTALHSSQLILDTAHCGVKWRSSSSVAKAYTASVKTRPGEI